MPKGESNKFVYDTSPETGKPLTTHQWYDGTQHPWEFKRVWHLEPSLTDPETVYAGVEDAAIFRTDRRRQDRGTNWPACAAATRGRNGSRAQAGCVCTRFFSIQSNPQRMFIAISAAGAFRTDDGGKTWKSDQSRAAIAIHSRSERGGRSLRPSHRDAPVASERVIHAKALGRDAHGRCRRFVAGSQRQLANVISDSRSTSMRTSRKRFTSYR